ncbi:MAG: hypothetical protein ACRC3Y_17965 [Romboutsia sp.]|uniref:hypothetical protein n=1 Tax=Romboutsia sp. TaxID=1965302 RepID=UPI003F2A0096
MMPSKDLYMVDDEDMAVLVKDLNGLVKTFFISFKTIELFANIELGKIEKFYKNECGITYEESVRVYNVIYSFKDLCDRLNYKKNL